MPSIHVNSLVVVPRLSLNDAFKKKLSIRDRAWGLVNLPAMLYLPLARLLDAIRPDRNGEESRPAVPVTKAAWNGRARDAGLMMI
jgi:hypothetical protein